MARRRLFSRRVLRIEYEHEDDPEDTSRVHDFEGEVCMYALNDGTVLLESADPEEPVWGDFPDGVEEE